MMYLQTVRQYVIPIASRRHNVFVAPGLFVTAGGLPPHPQVGHGVPVGSTPFRVYVLHDPAAVGGVTPGDVRRCYHPVDLHDAHTAVVVPQACALAAGALDVARLNVLYAPARGRMVTAEAWDGAPYLLDLHNQTTARCYRITRMVRQLKWCGSSGCSISEQLACDGDQAELQQLFGPNAPRL
jgi:hypothetical protein